MPKQEELSKCMKDIIISEINAHKIYRRISSTQNVPVSTVGFIVKKWEESGTTENMMRSGTPRKISERTHRQMMRTVRNDPFVTRQELQTDLSRNWTNDCKRTISDERHRQDLMSRRSHTTPLLKKTHLKSIQEFEKNAFK